MFKRGIIFPIILFLSGFAGAQEPANASSPEVAEPEISGVLNTYFPVNGLYQWEYQLDVSDLEEGVYNILVEGRDSAGNRKIAEAVDINIDPDSDLPRVSLAYPTEGEVLRGNINILGSAEDDDGVDYVELRLGDKPFERAEGYDYWSYELKTEDLKDGIYTIYARSVDIYGSAGPEKAVTFHIDRSAPAIDYKSHSNGDFVSGKIDVSGTAEDQNGISEIRYSLDNGETYRAAKVKGKEPDAPYEFSFNLDTRDLPDGPLTIQAEGMDKKGSRGTGSLLLYVDNTSPNLEILSPTEESLINGQYTVIGRVSDDVGVQSLQYSPKGEEPLEIPLEPGNPFWLIHLDGSGEKQGVVNFTVTDIAGNTTEYDFKHPIDLETDIPKLTVHSPDLDGNIITPSLSGWILDNTSASGIRYSIDKSPEKEVESGMVFNIPIPETRPGSHTITLRSYDWQGLESEEETREFSIPAAPPEIEFLEYYLADKTTEKYTPGKEVSMEELPGISGKITFASGTGTARFELPDKTSGEVKLKKAAAPGEYTFQLRLEDISGTGFYPITLTAQDSQQSRSVEKAILWLPGAGSDGIYPITPSQPNEPNTYRFDETMEFLFHGNGINRAELKGSDDFSLSHSGDILTLTSLTPSRGDNLTVEVQDNDGKIWEYGPFTCITDNEAPALQITGPLDGTILGDMITITGNAQDILGIETLQYSVNGSDFQNIEAGAPESSGFTVEVPLTSLPDGQISILFQAVDTTGNASFAEKLYIKDTTPPELLQILPEPGEQVNGLTTVILTVKDEWSESFAGELRIGEESTPLEVVNKKLAVPIDLAPYEEVPEDLVIAVKDHRGNEALFHPVLAFAPETDKPQVQIHVPLEESLILTDTVFSGIVLDDDGVASIEYRIDQGDFVKIGEGSSFEIPILLSSLSDNHHTLEVRAFDLGGVESDVVSVGFEVSLESPETQLISPDITITNKETITLAGTSWDANGMEGVYVSVDNGNTFHKARGTEQWTYSLDTTLLVDGSYMILLKGVDSYGIEGISSALIKVDNTAPIIELSNPRDGASARDELFIQMRVSDEISVDRISYTLTPLESETPDENEEGPSQPALKEELEIRDVVLHKIDISGLPAGRYNLSLFAEDSASNEVLVSRNVLKIDSSIEPVPEILFPFDGAYQTGEFNLEGQIRRGDPVAKVALIIDGLPFDVVETDPLGYFSRPILPEELSDGEHTVQAELTLESGKTITGGLSGFTYSKAGPWIRIDSVKSGDFVGNRPWISGSLDYPLEPAANEEEPSKEQIRNHEVSLLEYSLDNGKQFVKFKAREAWKFRLETQEIPDGPLGILVKATFRDGSTAVTKVFVEVDETSPELSVLTPLENSRFNDLIDVSGTAFDLNGLEDISVMLREGSKASHELPQFIQGLYIDTHFLGGTTWELGAGLTFFDDNVRLQALIGQAPEGRFNGTVFGLKLLANVATLPYGYFFGPDFDFLSSSLAVGSAFEYFTMTESPIDQSGLVLGAMTVQLELIKVELEQLKFFNTFSLYMENQFWFISSDIEGGLEYRIAFGIRSNVF